LCEINLVSLDNIFTHACIHQVSDSIPVQWYHKIILSVLHNHEGFNVLRVGNILVKSSCSSKLKFEVYRYDWLWVLLCCEKFHYYCTKIEHTQNTRNKKCLLKIPKLRAEFGKKSAQFMAAKTCNYLPIETRKEPVCFLTN